MEEYWLHGSSLTIQKGAILRPDIPLSGLCVNNRVQVPSLEVFLAKCPKGGIL